MTDKTTSALKLAEEALLNTGNALMVISAGRNLRQLYGEMRDDAVERCNKALAAIREALAEPDIEEMTLTQIASRHEPVKQEPVAIVVSKYGDPESFGERRLEVLIDIQALPYDTPFYAAPVDAKAIRSEALEEAAKVCEAKQSYNAMHANTEFAAAIRGLK